MKSGNAEAKEICGQIMEKKDYLVKSPSGLSAETAGLMISDTAVSTMYWHPAKTSISWYLILKFTPTQAVRLPRRLRRLLSQNLLHPVRE